MKLKHLLLTVILLTFILSACAKNEAVATEDTLLANIYTSVVITLSAEAKSYTLTPSVTPLEPLTPTLNPTPTAIILVNTQVPVSTAYSSYSTANGCYDSLFISDVTIPDGTNIAPSEEFVKTWRFQNSGSCDWDEDFLLKFISGSELEGEDITINAAISIGSEVDISVTLVAPASEGTYTGYWRLADAEGDVFGQAVYVLITVSEDATTSTPTLTTTLTSTSASDATATTATTATPMPTSTFTTVPTNTFTPTPSQTPVSTEDSIPTSDDSPDGG